MLAFVIWKDYNCGQRIIAGKNGPEPMVYDSMGVRKTLTSSFNFETEDLWNGCVHITKTYSDYSAGGYSVVASQDSDSEFYGRVCWDGDYYIYTKKDLDGGAKPFYSVRDSRAWGNAYLFQTRM